MSEYIKGDRITTFDELFNTKFIMFHDKVYNIGWFQNYQLRYVWYNLDNGNFYKAIKKDKTVKNITNESFNNIVKDICNKSSQDYKLLELTPTQTKGLMLCKNYLIDSIKEILEITN